MPTTSDLQDYPRYSISPTYAFIVTNDYDLVDHALTNYTMSSDNNPASYPLSDANYGVQIFSSLSFMLSLSDSFSQSLPVSPGQNITLDLP